MRHGPVAFAVFLLAGCASPGPERSAAPTPDPAPLTGEGAGGYVLLAGAGERLDYCGRPLTLWLKVDSATAPATRLVAGIAELRGDEGPGTHRDADEVLYVIRGEGHALVDGDTLPLVPGSVAWVPQGLTHRLVSTGPTPMEYLFVIGPRSSAAGFRRAAAVDCEGGGAAAAPSPAQTTSPPATGTPQPVAARVIPPGGGDRLRYCELPLDFTLKVDSASAAGTRLRAATGALRTGSEYGVHRGSDEVAYIIAGHGWAIVGADTVPVGPGSLAYVPRGTPHGFVNRTEQPLEYIVVHSPETGTAGFRRRASLPGPYCRD